MGESVSYSLYFYQSKDMKEIGENQRGSVRAVLPVHKKRILKNGAMSLERLRYSRFFLNNLFCYVNFPGCLVRSVSRLIDCFAST